MGRCTGSDHSRGIVGIMTCENTFLVVVKVLQVSRMIEVIGRLEEDSTEGDGTEKKRLIEFATRKS